MFQSRTDDLYRVDDPCLEKIFVDLRRSVEAETTLAGTDFLDDYRALGARVARDLAQRLLNGTLNKAHAICLVAREGQALERRGSAEQSDSAACNNTLFDGCTRRVKGVFHSRLLVLHLGLGVGTDFDHGHAACEFGKPFLQFLLVIGACSLGHIFANGLDPALNLLWIARPIDDRGAVLVDLDALGTAEITKLKSIELDPKIVARHLPVSENGYVLEHILSAVTESRRLDCYNLQQATQLVDYERR